MNGKKVVFGGVDPAGARVEIAIVDRDWNANPPKHVEVSIMCEETDAGKSLPPDREGWLNRFARRFEPYGILIAVFALIVAFVTLWVEIDLRHRTLIVMEEERDLRKKTLDALKEEKDLRTQTLTALEDDKILREASLLSMLLERIKVSRMEKSPFAGHVPIIERLVRIGVDLRDIDVTSVDFSVDDGIVLIGGDLSYVDFKGSDLSEAQLAGATLINANFRDTDLNDANFEYADLTQADLRQAYLLRGSLVGAILDGTNLKETDVTGVDFKGVKELIQAELDNACADPEEPPVNLPKDSKTGKQLVWKEKACEES